MELFGAAETILKEFGLAIFFIAVVLFVVWGDKKILTKQSEDHKKQIDETIKQWYERVNSKDLRIDELHTQHATELRAIIKENNEIIRNTHNAYIELQKAIV